VHPSERRSKCSVEPLRGRAGFAFSTFAVDDPPDVSGYVRLGLGGPVLSRNTDGEAGLLILDGTWRYAARMEVSYANVAVRGLPPFRTAYPRTSKLFDNPEGGLATIEAVFAAHLILGRPVERLLDAYHWKEEFLDLNAALIDSWSKSE